MKANDTVRVYPVGEPSRAALATVAILSSNGRAIAVGFDERPPFPIGDPLSMAVHPEHGIMLFASRANMEAPWIEMMGGEAFTIEEAQDEGKKA